MTSLNQVYKCQSCGNIVEVLHASAGELVCCEQPMLLLAENTVDASKEKHVPVLTRVPGGVKVAIGSVAHPMEEKHFIEFIELLAGEQVQRRFLHPGEAPVAFFETAENHVAAREYCNLHGLWRSEE
jgi:superoxide reductase